MNFIKTWWSDPGNRALVARFAVFIFGVLVKSGKIPTGMEGLGEQIGPLISGSALLIRAGQTNPK